MFEMKKIYKITYVCFFSRSMAFVDGKDKVQALKKFRKEIRKQMYIVPDVISIEEV